MGEKKLPMFLNEQKLKEEFSLNWSKRTIGRRIANGFPAIRDGESYLFPTKEVIDYFKRRTVKPE